MSAFGFRVYNALSLGSNIKVRLDGAVDVGQPGEYPICIRFDLEKRVN